MNMQKLDDMQAYKHFLKGEYEQASRLFEIGVEQNGKDLQYRWYLGLTYLLQGDEDAAELTWLLAMDQENDQALKQQKIALAQVLEKEASRLESLDDVQTGWLIRQYLREITPTNVENFLRFIELGLETSTDIATDLADGHLVKLLQDYPLGTIDAELLHRVLLKLLTNPIFDPSTLEILKSALPHVTAPEILIDQMVVTAIKLRYEANQNKLAADLAELCLIPQPLNVNALKQVSCLLTDAYRFTQGIEVAQQFYNVCDTPALKLLGGHLLLRALLNAGIHGPEVQTVKAQHETWLEELATDNPVDLTRGHAISLPCVNFFLYYLQDKPRQLRAWQNQTAKIAQQNLRSCAKKSADIFQSRSRKNTYQLNSSRPLRIGYIAHTLKRHSVGWLSRWLLQHHDHNAVHVSIYLFSQGIDEFTKHWFVNQADTYWCGRDRDKAIQQILADEIDILVDLDSYTLDGTAEIMALKPAPVQVTWLGADASGLPSIDYFIADPYVLPDDAQSYYQEKIWRLPHTYVAVDGFEVGVPTLRREDLDLPLDGIIYLSSQSGPKRYPDTVRLQLKILKEVPNSYLLIKGRGDQSTIQELFTRLATEEGVDPAYLRFLENAPSEPIHRANLGIADVILDTYPYNGATTTLEALWVGVPIVTRVGQQFAARNSYTFLTNAGVTEGIAWTDEEYVEWGIRLGKEKALRQKVGSKLKASRQNAPLWNTKQFTREMEKSYQQMWQIYLESYADK